MLFLAVAECTQQAQPSIRENEYLLLPSPKGLENGGRQQKGAGRPAKRG